MRLKFVKEEPAKEVKIYEGRLIIKKSLFDTICRILRIVDTLSRSISYIGHG